jgi:hypothetical protein
MDAVPVGRTIGGMRVVVLCCVVFCQDKLKCYVQVLPIVWRTGGCAGCRVVSMEGPLCG